MYSHEIKNTRFLVTGGAGFIGSNIVAHLVKHEGNKVRVLDNLSTGNYNNISSFESDPRFEFIHGDICDYETCVSACDGIDVVLHQAALGSVPRSISNPIATNRVNIDGFLNVLWAAKEKLVKRFVYASSSSVYGDDKNMPKIETKTGKLLSPYAVSKSANEEYAKVFSKVYDLKTVGLRYFNVFGPNQSVNGPYAAVIPLFIEACLSNKPAVIFGDGNTTRDFTYVDNVVKANMLAALNDLSENGPVFNVAFGSTTSLNSLFNMIAEFSGYAGKPVYGSERLGDIKDSWADISSIAASLGYRPETGVEEGLRKTVEWFRKNRQ